MEFTNGELLILDISNIEEKSKIVKYNTILLNEINCTKKITTKTFNKLVTKSKIKLNTDFLGCKY